VSCCPGSTEPFIKAFIKASGLQQVIQADAIASFGAWALDIFQVEIDLEHTNVHQSLSCANRPWIKFRRFLFLLYCTALFLTGWWIGWVLLLLIVPAGGRLDIFERERRMRMGQQTIKLVGYRSGLDPD
jgi:hypothetical protein